MKEAAKGLRALLPRLDVVVTSPLTRAMQTAVILSRTYETSAPLKADALMPGQPPPALAAWLKNHATHKTVAVVGHEPGLGATVSWLTAGSERSFLELGKGGACLLELGARIEAGDAMLVWVLRPSQLRELGD